MSAASLPRGPLQVLLRSSSGQWIVLGLGAYVLFPDQVQLALQRALLNLSAVSQNQLSPGNGSGNQHPMPLIIHTMGGGNNGSGGGSTSFSSTTTVLMQYVVGATVLYFSYQSLIQSDFIPDQIKAMLPASRYVLDRAVSQLGKGLLTVKDTLGQQILNIGKKQDQLSKTQDDTLQDVRIVRNEVEQARVDLNIQHELLDRCHESLESLEQMQTYTAQGVQLLVRCVVSMLPANDRITAELQRYIQVGSGHPSASYLETLRRDPSSRVMDRSESTQPILLHSNTTSSSSDDASATMSREHNELMRKVAQQQDKVPEKKNSFDNIEELMKLIKAERVEDFRTAY